MKITKDIVLKFIKFGIVGFSGMFVDYGFLALFVEVCRLPELLSNAFSFTLAASWNYMLNRIWTFGSKEKKVGVEYAKFFTVSLIGLGISTLTIWLLELAMPDWSAASGKGFECVVFVKYFYVLKFISIVVTTLWNFLGNYLYTFRRKQK